MLGFTSSVSRKRTVPSRKGLSCLWRRGLMTTSIRWTRTEDSLSCDCSLGNILSIGLTRQGAFRCITVMEISPSASLKFVCMFVFACAPLHVCGRQRTTQHRTSGCPQCPQCLSQLLTAVYFFTFTHAKQVSVLHLSCTPSPWSVLW